MWIFFSDKKMKVKTKICRLVIKLLLHDKESGKLQRISNNRWNNFSQHFVFFPKEVCIWAAQVKFGSYFSWWMLNYVNKAKTQQTWSLHEFLPTLQTFHLEGQVSGNLTFSAPFASQPQIKRFVADERETPARWLKRICALRLEKIKATSRRLRKKWWRWCWRTVEADLILYRFISVRQPPPCSSDVF